MLKLTQICKVSFELISAWYPGPVCCFKIACFDFRILLAPENIKQEEDDVFSEGWVHLAREFKFRFLGLVKIVSSFKSTYLQAGIHQFHFGHMFVCLSLCISEDHEFWWIAVHKFGQIPAHELTCKFTRVHTHVYVQSELALQRWRSNDCIHSGDRAVLWNVKHVRMRERQLVRMHEHEWQLKLNTCLFEKWKFTFSSKTVLGKVKIDRQDFLSTFPHTFLCSFRTYTSKSNQPFGSSLKEEDRQVKFWVLKTCSKQNKGPQDGVQMNSKIVNFDNLSLQNLSAKHADSTCFEVQWKAINIVRQFALPVSPDHQRFRFWEHRSEFKIFRQVSRNSETLHKFE